MSNPSIVGGKDCPISRVITTLQKASTFGEFHEKWSDLARELGTVNEKITKLRNDQLVNKITMSDALHEIVEEWVARQAMEASLHMLISAIEQIGMRECADALRTEFGQRCLLRGKLKGTFPHRLAYYVNRTLVTRNIISKKIFDRNSKDILLLTGMERYELSRSVKGTTFSSSEQLISGSKISQGSTGILNQPHHFGKICEKTDHPVHWLHRESDGRLRWLRSKGRVTTLQGYIDQDQDKIKEEEFPLKLGHNFNHPICISDSPGMGKSVLLSEIGRKLRELYPDRTVAFMVARELVKLVKESKDTISAVKEVFRDIDVGMANPDQTSKVSNIDFEISVELLLDGFDEVDGADTELAYSIIRIIKISFEQIRLWITSRPHFLHKLENKLDTLGYNIQPFNKEDQADFLASFWAGMGTNLDKQKLLQFGVKCVDSLTQILSSEEHDIAGIPLQCLLIGEVFSNGAIDYAQEDGSSPYSFSDVGIQSISSLYALLIAKKISKYQSMYEVDDEETSAGTSRGSELTEKEIMDMHAQLSLELLFPTEIPKLKSLCAPVQLDEILRVGLVETVEKEHVRFIHRTFAEYFVAWFVSDKLGSPTLWNETMSQFLMETVLQRAQDWKRIYFFGFTSYKLYNPVIAYFLNSKMIEYQIMQLASLSLFIESSDSERLMSQLAHACVRGDHLHLFDFFLQMGCFSSCEDKIFDRNLVVLSIAKSKFLVKPCLTLFSKHHNFDLDMQVKTLRVAVFTGGFSTLEFLLKEEGLSGIVKEGKGLTNLLLYDCLAYSNKNTERQIENKIQIIRTLVEISPALLEREDSSGSTPLVAAADASPDVRLLNELVKMGSDMFATNKEKDTILHLIKNMKSAQEIQSFIMNIPLEILKKLIRIKNKNRKVPLFILLEEHDLTSATLHTFKTAGMDFRWETENGDFLLAVAIKYLRNAGTIRKLIELGCDIFWRGKGGMTLLHLAAHVGNLEAAKMFLDFGLIDVNCKADGGQTPMDYIFKNLEIYECGNVFATGWALHERGGTFRQKFTLDTATRYSWPLERKLQQLKLLHYLQAVGVDVTKTQKKNSLLHRFGDKIFAKKRPTTGSYFNFMSYAEVSNNPMSVMHVAVENEDVGTVEQLLKINGSGINTKTQRQYTTLHYAAFARNKDIGLNIIQHLIDNGVDIYAYDNSGRTFIHNFILFSKPTSNQFHKLVKCLLNKYDHASVAKLFNTKGGYISTTPLLEAVHHIEIDQETLLTLYFSGADFNAVDKDGNSILTYALWGRRSELVLKSISIILQFGHAIVDSAQFDQFFFLTEPTLDYSYYDLSKYQIIYHMNPYRHYLIFKILNNENVELELVSFILSKMPAALEERKYTPLHYAALIANKKFAVKLIKMCISNGADLYAKDNGNRTFLHLFITSSKPSPLELHSMTTVLAGVNASKLFHIPGGRDQATPLHEAALNTEMEEETLALLLQNGVDFRTVDSDGNSIWTYAVWGRRSEKFMQFLAKIPGIKPKSVGDSPT